MSISVATVSAQQVSDIVHELDATGFACVPNYIHAEDVMRMQGFVKEAIQKSKNEYVHFNGPDTVSGSGLDELAHSALFTKLIYDVYESGTGKSPHKEEFYQVLRCLAGSSGQKNSMIFHYDSYIITALVPVQIPTEGRAGDLLMYPNTRRIRGSYWGNAVDKVLLDNPLTQKLLRACAVSSSRKLSPTRIKMVPGNLYLFWGYRSIHTNEPCDPDQVRATALFHYANPHRKQ